MAKKTGGQEEEIADYNVIGPRHLSIPSWRDLIRSSWTDTKYRRIAISCFVEAAYLHELDRQEKRTGENALAPNWWKPFKYKLLRLLKDPRDGSVYGVLLEWDQISALSDFIVVRPNGAPKCVLALRGTILKHETVMRDFEDDFRFFACENLKGSVRFTGALEALHAAIEKHGSSNICIGGHSLGAGFALQIGKHLAKDGVFVECHLFNPPSASLATGLKKLQEKAGTVLKKFIGGGPSNGEISHDDNDVAVWTTSSDGEEKMLTEVKRWVPYLYINNCDYICCHYADRTGVATVTAEKPKKHDGHHDVAAKLFVSAKGPKKFLEAHGLQQWWSDDSELQLAAHDSSIIYRQLKSLYVKEP